MNDRKNVTVLSAVVCTSLTRPRLTAIDAIVASTISASGTSNPLRRSRTRGSTRSDETQPTTMSPTSRRYGSSWNGRSPGIR
jgi:hypothetical protein